MTGLFFFMLRRRMAKGPAHVRSASEEDAEEEGVVGREPSREEVRLCECNESGRRSFASRMSHEDAGGPSSPMGPIIAHSPTRSSIVASSLPQTLPQAEPLIEEPSCDTRSHAPSSPSDSSTAERRGSSAEVTPLLSLTWRTARAPLIVGVRGKKVDGSRSA